MAEQDDSAEKEFEATEQRLKQAREEGNVPQSKEANALALLLGVVIAAVVLNAVLAPGLFNNFSSMLYHGDSFAEDAFNSGGSAIWVWLGGVLLLLLPLFLIMAALVLAALIIKRSISFSMKKIQIDMKKISPAENLKKRYEVRGLLDFLKDTVKLLFAGIVGTVFLVQFVESYYASAEIQMGSFYEFTFNQVLRLILYFVAFQAGLALIDLPLQRQLHMNKLKMSREEMKKEAKESEG